MPLRAEKRISTRPANRSMASATRRSGEDPGIGPPFWLAGGYGSAGKATEALAAGADRLQVGTAFAYCAESAHAGTSSAFSEASCPATPGVHRPAGFADQLPVQTVRSKARSRNRSLCRPVRASANSASCASLPPARRQDRRSLRRRTQEAALPRQGRRTGPHGEAGNVFAARCWPTSAWHKSGTASTASRAWSLVETP